MMQVEEKFADFLLRSSYIASLELSPSSSRPHGSVNASSGASDPISDDAVWHGAQLVS